MDISTARLRAFVAVADTSSFTEAARALHVTQQSVSSTVRRLEDELGVRLLDRSTRSVVLTAVGTTFADDARRTLAMFDTTIIDVRRRARRATGHLVVGAMAGAALELTDPIVAAFRERHRGTTVEFEHHLYDDPSAGIRHGSVDVAFVRPPFDARGITTHPLFVEPRVAVMATSHRLAKRRVLDVEDLDGELLIRPDSPDEKWNSFWGLDRRRGDTIRARTLEGALEVVSTSGGVSVAALGWVRFFPRRGLTYVPLRGVVGSTLSIARLTTERNELVRGFIRAARTVCAERLSQVPDATAP
jgi:DNA-binding transcriptional LysR family regulator